MPKRQPTFDLRFVQREGKYILQQLFMVADADNPTIAHKEWIDVPVGKEE